VTDAQTKDRVQAMLNGSSQDGRTTEHPLVASQTAQQDQALHVLTMAQRTAEEHVAGAHRQAETIHADAMATAEQIAREAEAHAQNVRREADKVLFEARATKEQSGRDAQARVDQARQSAEKILADAQARAGKIAADAQAGAEEQKSQAQRRYEDIVGSLGAKRASLQQQIETLERFDREYRARLTAFMQGQVRALWMDQPQVTGELQQTATEPAAKPAQQAAPAQQAGPAQVGPAQVGPAQHGSAQHGSGQHRQPTVVTQRPVPSPVEVKAPVPHKA
jgi:vacuolar-type H+-ATPase subunit H